MSEAPARAEPEPSFFPVLHDEATGFQNAANDDPALNTNAAPVPLDSEAWARFASRPQGTSRKLMVGSAGVALAAMLLGFYLFEPPSSRAPQTMLRALPNAEPHANDAAPVTLAYAAPVVAAPLPVAPQVAVARNNRVDTHVVAARPLNQNPGRRVSRATAPVAKVKDRPATAAVTAVAPPPVQTPCTAEVVALGLCTNGSR